MITTDRLILRRWQERDHAVFHAQCSDPRVMRFLGPTLSREQVEATLERHNGYLARHGYCFWAVERQADAALLGFCGLKPGAPGTPIEGMVEIGWRFGADHWGHGYAREAAAASLAWAWDTLDAEAVAAITAAGNVRSRALMERIGMTRVADGDFDHPIVAQDSPLRRHVQYRIARPRSS